MPTPDRDPAPVVLILARALAAASGRERVAMPALQAACGSIPMTASVTGRDLGKIMSAAGWQHRQWRENAGRVRGYQKPDAGQGEIGGCVRADASTVARASTIVEP